jgi:hypothetical protein
MRSIYCLPSYQNRIRITDLSYASSYHGPARTTNGRKSCRCHACVPVFASPQKYPADSYLRSLERLESTETWIDAWTEPIASFTSSIIPSGLAIAHFTAHQNSPRTRWNLTRTQVTATKVSNFGSATPNPRCLATAARGRAGGWGLGGFTTD